MDIPGLLCDKRRMLGKTRLVTVGIQRQLPWQLLGRSNHHGDPVMGIHVIQKIQNTSLLVPGNIPIPEEIYSRDVSLTPIR